jgi:thiamine biosynthesis lipoprotein
MRYVILDRASRTISFERSGMGLDFGGVAKGYATDSAAAVLKRMGVRNAVVSCGGDIYCIGKRSGSGMWNVGIQHPRNRRKMLFRMEIEDMAVDTSGDYEKYYFVKGRRYSHIIDPRTGYPIGDGIISATVVARDAVTADMLATALCVLGRRGLGVVNRIEGAGALIVHNENGVFRPEATEGFIGRFNVRSR